MISFLFAEVGDAESFAGRSNDQPELVAVRVVEDLPHRIKVDDERGHRLQRQHLAVDPDAALSFEEQVQLFLFAVAMRQRGLSRVEPASNGTPCHLRIPTRAGASEVKSGATGLGAKE